MKKVLLSAVVALSTLGICVANSDTSKAQTSTKSFNVVKDTTDPTTTTDTTKKDSTLLLK